MSHRMIRQLTILFDIDRVRLQISLYATHRQNFKNENQFLGPAYFIPPLKLS
jgi:hypothetical protein